MIIDLPAPDDTAPYISIAELAKFWAVSTRTIYRDIEKGSLTAYRLPQGTIRILIEDARAYGRPDE